MIINIIIIIIIITSQDDDGPKMGDRVMQHKEKVSEKSRFILAVFDVGLLFCKQQQQQQKQQNWSWRTRSFV